ncbi:protoheme IX biogenesis protein HemY [Budviciaceae bacterium CWB-B4]|uniref:Protoheme IX biogenesis protein HemY n=1 Tax=Limnobaculum xujianqingii TaxID=2738837 RepID=A0A9D7FWA6_9GAMM|nr:protoheme IX biogenesis protein HemY [Limnobaculum xujianqingii]MBK5074907.1 protoheme IX biogenesis protein HemY [Limnobaculum xujianqingii]MBK5178217.1 protoheme IX biogenesis protein HemY [Limnobaculum xujianqingii]
MLRLLFLLLILVAGIAAGPMLAGHQGSVMIQTDNYDIKMSVTGLAILIALLFIVLFCLEWVLRRIFHTSARTKGWFVGRKSTRARKQTRAAMLKLTEGDFSQVEKLLTRNADHAEQPVVNYLLAAEAAQQNGDTQRVNDYLSRAAELADTDQLPVDITRIRIQLAQGEYHAARHGIDQLLNDAPRHPEVLRLAQQAYLKTGGYASLLEIIPSIEKAKLYDEDTLETLRLDTYIGLMNQAMSEGGSEGLKLWWKNQPRKVRNNQTLQVELASHFIDCDDNEQAQKIILDGLKHQYDERLILLIQKLESGNPDPLEKELKMQIQEHGATPLLNSTLGQLLIKHGEWEQASVVLKQAIEQHPDAKDYALLADALDKLNRSQEAAQIRRQGLSLSLK